LLLKLELLLEKLIGTGNKDVAKKGDKEVSTDDDTAADGEMEDIDDSKDDDDDEDEEEEEVVEAEAEEIAVGEVLMLLNTADAKVGVPA
jgi:hypothetical protein